ncbi:hypothetical protein [Nocardioides abyssi]|uniref:Uncharacterized protein n=1 Tax=Nocardioides abyssi TaxID=3058370 RepID=A0ABT8EY23_9ACTN|nr:hypothetical protein [Nocardioides abyssi]MDN4163092.1 hypothetical protein [Nocardioides abyssi]
MPPGPLRAVGWLVAVVVAVLWAFSAGVEWSDARHCGPQATDCDLGALDGILWAAVALLGVLLVMACVELWLLVRRRRAVPGVDVAGRG